MAVLVGARPGILYIPLSEMIRLLLKPEAVNTTNQSSDDIFGRDSLKHKESREATLSLIDLISSMGDLSYRDLYEHYARE